MRRIAVLASTVAVAAMTAMGLAAAPAAHAGLVDDAYEAVRSSETGRAVCETSTPYRQFLHDADQPWRGIGHLVFTYVVACGEDGSPIIDDVDRKLSRYECTAVVRIVVNGDEASACVVPTGDGLPED